MNDYTFQDGVVAGIWIGVITFSLSWQLAGILLPATILYVIFRRD